MTASSPPLETRISVRVRPGARRTRFVGRMADGRLKFEVQAPAEGGQANRALLLFLRKTYGLEAEILRGHHSRDKVLQIRGALPPEWRK